MQVLLGEKLEEDPRVVSPMLGLSEKSERPRGHLKKIKAAKN